MAETISSPFDMTRMSRDMLAAQQRFLSSAGPLQQMSKAMEIVSAAQIAYAEACMQASSMMLGMVLQRGEMAREMSPSEAAHQPDCAA